MATLSEIVDDLIDNADFEESGSVSKARAFITAATKYLILKPTSQSNQSSSLSWDNNQIQSLLARARDFVAARSNRVRFLGVGTDFR
jgi:hypothetical protein